MIGKSKKGKKKRKKKKKPAAALVLFVDFSCWIPFFDFVFGATQRL
jgi:hypothetical protein